MKSRYPGIPRRLALGCAVALTLGACSRTPEATTADAAVVPVNTAAPPVNLVAAPEKTSVAPVATTLGNEIDDSVVTTRVKSALLADQDVKSFEIKVETRKGQVQLSGFVDNPARIAHAVALVGGIEGVKGVDNAMSVKDGKATVGNTVDDGIVTTRVRAALLADSTIRSGDIGVATRKGEVQLSGFVTSQAQINRAVAVTREVAGVRDVDNEMNIKK